MTMPSQDMNWVSIAEQASLEMDPAKLASLVEQLCRALDDRGAPANDEMKIGCGKSSHSVWGPSQTAGSD